MFVGTAIAALVLGFLSGLLAFRVKQRWCAHCGATLACPDRAHHRVLNS